MTKSDLMLSAVAVVPLSYADDDLLTQHQAAPVVGVKVPTLELWRCRGGGPPFLKIGRLVRYRYSTLQAWLRSRERSSTSDRGGAYAPAA